MKTESNALAAAVRTALDDFSAEKSSIILSQPSTNQN